MTDTRTEDSLSVVTWHPIVCLLVSAMLIHLGLKFTWRFHLIFGGFCIGIAALMLTVNYLNRQHRRDLNGILRTRL